MNFLINFEVECFFVIPANMKEFPIFFTIVIVNLSLERIVT